MELIDLKEDIKQIAYMLKRMLNADVIVVDRHLNSLINTFEYEKKPIDIKVNSAVGSVIVSGEMKIVEDKSCFDECRNCPQYEDCEIASIVGVPVTAAQKCIGAIALLIQKRREYHPDWTFEDAVIFLGQIAEMLGNKIQNVTYAHRIEEIPGMISSVLNHMAEAAAVVDEQKSVLFYNQRFEAFFGDGTEMAGRNIEEILSRRIGRREAKAQSYGNGTGFQKYADGITELSFVQEVENDEKKERYLYVFQDVSTDIFLKKQAKNYELKGWMERFFGPGPEMSAAKAAAEQALNNELSIMITGKDKVQSDELARMYLMKYAADGKGILEIECGSEEHLLEQKLFGIPARFHGYLDMAKGKALCLYSAEHLPLHLQKKVVEYLVKNQMRGQFGSSIRMIVTSEKDLKDLVEKGLFSDKLYYYISRNQIYVPLASENKEDLKHCFRMYLDDYAAVYQRQQSIKVKDDVWDYLTACRWEEGTRSLRQFAELLVMEMNTNIVTVGLIKRIQFKYGYKRMGGMEDEKEEQIRELLLYSGKTKKEIAEELGIGRATLYRWLSKYNL